MKPQGTRVLRREQRRAWKATPTGRHATHRVVTTYGRGQELAAHIERWRGFTAARRAADAVYLGLIIPVAVYENPGQEAAA
jgi:hypothetical protein